VAQPGLVWFHRFGRQVALNIGVAEVVSIFALFQILRCKQTNQQNYFPISFSKKCKDTAVILQDKEDVVISNLHEVMKNIEANLVLMWKMMGTKI
jgi:hypothetical protein